MIMELTPEAAPEKTIQQLLDDYAEYQSKLDTFNLEKTEAIQKVYTPEIARQIADIEAECVGKASTATENIATLKQVIKDKLLSLPAEQRETQKGALFMAVYKRGSVSYDTAQITRRLKKLAEKYPAIAPEIADILEDCTKTGAASVAIQAR
jgi:hypothetical protein